MFSCRPASKAYVSMNSRVGVTPPLDMTGVATALEKSGVAMHSRNERNATLDILRLAGAFVIVLFHARSPGGQLMPAAMAVFSALMGYLAMADRKDQPFGATVRKRADRLLRPFLIWGGIYATMRIGDALAGGDPLLKTMVDWLPPRGTMGQLWFLPFAFLASLAVILARRMLPAIATPVVALPLATVIALVWLPMLRAMAPAPGIAVYLDYIPAVFFGVALAAASATPMAIVLTGASALVIGLGFRFAGYGGTMPLDLGIPLLTAALLLPRRGTGLTRMAADLSMAIYLVHLFVLAVSLRVLPFPIGSLALGCVGICGSTLLALVLIRRRLGRHLI
jgi:peptidoglycan/LPS O-acetylase OafA/YrhL